MRSEYEGKLIEANDKFREIKTENEELKEKVDILFKLGRAYINKKKITMMLGIEKNILSLRSTLKTLVKIA